MIKKNYICGILTLLFANPAYAVLDCKLQPTCESLGYVDTDVSDCPVNAVLACPFDPKYKKCVIDCASIGFTESDKSSWCKNIIQCPADNNYTLCQGLDCSVFGYNLTQCPTGANCGNCSGYNGERYKIIDCKSGYVLADGTCHRAYESCYDAGYLESTDNTDNSEDCSTVSIYLTNGTQKTCYDDCSCSTDSEEYEGRCMTVYADCDSAGYFDNNTNRNCASDMVSVYNGGGNFIQCYANCKCKDGYTLRDGSCVEKPDPYWDCTDRNAALNQCSAAYEEECNRSGGAACQELESCIRYAPECVYVTSDNGMLQNVMIASLHKEECIAKYTSNLENQIDGDFPVYKA